MHFLCLHLSEMSKTILLLVAILCSAKGLFAPTGRIIGGELASSGQFPYIVSITEDGRHFCAGFIYSSRWIVTAASCVVGKSLAKLNVVVGQLSALNLDVNEQTMVVYTITPYPQYHGTNKAYDIALVRLTTEISFDYEYVDFIGFNNEVDYTRAALTMGWGVTYDGGYESVSLRCGSLLAIDNSTCGGYRDGDFNFSTMICAAATLINDVVSGSPYTYDEGSPLVQEFADFSDPSRNITTAVGFYSKAETSVLGQPVVYTRLSFFGTWLLSTAGPQPVRPSKR